MSETMSEKNVDHLKSCFSCPQTTAPAPAVFSAQSAPPPPGDVWSPRPDLWR